MGGWIPKGRTEREGHRPRVRPARRTLGRAALPARPRAAGAAAVVGDRIVVAGGQADGRLIDTTEVFDGKQWRAGANIPTPREHLAAVSDGDYVYAVGGRALSPDKNSAALERYDPATDRWQQLPDMPTARGGLGAAIVGGHIFAVGGETPDARPGRGRSPTTSQAGLVERPVACAPPGTGSPWPRSAARSTRSAARRDPATRAHRRPGRCSGSRPEVKARHRRDASGMKLEVHRIGNCRPAASPGESGVLHGAYQSAVLTESPSRGLAAALMSIASPQACSDRDPEPGMRRGAKHPA